MWFKLAKADWSGEGNNLGTMDSLMNAWSVTYSISGGLTKLNAPAFVTKGSTLTATFTLAEGATITGTPSSTSGTVSTPSVSGTTVTITVTGISKNCTVTIAATGGSVEPETPVNPPSGSTVQLTSSNAVFTTTDYHLAAMISGGPLVTSTQGTRGVMAWDIPAKALVTLTCSPNGNYGMAMTNSDGTLVLEAILNSTVATDGNGTYTFSPVLEASRLYVSTTKFVSASYVILSDEELTQYDFNVMLEFTSETGKYINTSQTVGSDVELADMGGTRYGISETIPANSIITLNVKTGGNYGMCIADTNGKVLQNNPSANADTDGNIVFDKQSVPCKLWVSITKFNKATYKLGG